MTSHATAILITLGVYYVAMALIGVVYARRTRDSKDFFLGGRKLGPIVASISASASSSSAWTLLGVSGFAYLNGVSSIWLFPACVGGFAFNWFVLAGPLRTHSRRTGAITTTEVIAGETQGPQRHIIVAIASFIILVSLASYVASQFQAAGKTFAETFDLSMTSSILIGSAIVVLYTMLGGFLAVSVTDTVQGLVMAATAIILPIVALAAVGAPNFIDGLRGVDETYLSIWKGMPASAGIGFAIGLLGIGLGYPGQPHVVNRFMAMAEGERTLRIAQWTAIGWAVVTYSGMILLGLCARIAFDGADDPEAVFMTVANTLLHPVIAGVMIAAVLSAVMSTADSQLLVAASSVTHDLGFGKSFVRGVLARSRIVVLLLSAAAVVAALTVEATIFDRVLFAWAAMGFAFGPLLLVTVLRGPVSARATIIAMTLGFGLSVGAYSFRKSGFEYPAQFAVLQHWGEVWERVLPFFVALVVAYAGSQRRARSR